MAPARSSFGGRITHAPAEHEAPPVHARPHIPQLALSFIVFVQAAVIPVPQND